MTTTQIWLRKKVEFKTVKAKKMSKRMKRENTSSRKSLLALVSLQGLPVLATSLPRVLVAPLLEVVVAAALTTSLVVHPLGVVLPVLFAGPIALLQQILVAPLPLPVMNPRNSVTSPMRQNLCPNDLSRPSPTFKMPTRTSNDSP